MNLFTEKYDDNFREIGKEENVPIEIGEYNRYPQMIPWVGCQYDNGNHKRVLLIGESHYLPDCADEEFRTPVGWYYQEGLDSDSESYSWTNTRKIVSIGPTIWTKGHSLYREVNKVIANIKGENSKEENMFQHVAYYNYFLRPAYPKGCSFKKVCVEMDENVAFNAFRNIVQIINPDFIYFFSKFAWDSLWDSLHKEKLNFTNIEMDYSPHPACSWWNRKNFSLKKHIELMTGREKFDCFLNDNKIF